MIEKVVHGLMSGDWKRGTVSGPQRLQPDAWTAPDLSATAPALDSVTEQLTWLAPPGRRLDELAPHPGRGRVRGDVDVQQLTPTMGDEHQHVKRLEGESLHRQQVRCPHVVIGSKDGALRHYCRTFPSSALRTGQATCRCTQLASNAPSPQGRCSFAEGVAHEV